MINGVGENDGSAVAGGVNAGGAVVCGCGVDVMPMTGSSNDGIFVVGGTVGGRGIGLTPIFCMPGDTVDVEYGGGTESGSWSDSRRFASSIFWTRIATGIGRASFTDDGPAGAAVIFDGAGDAVISEFVILE